MNEAFELLQAGGLDPKEFEWHKVQGTPRNSIVSELRHKETGYYFRFDYSTTFDQPVTGRYAKFSPSKGGRSGSQRSTIDQPLVMFRHWVECLKRELDAPDLWAMLAEETARLQALATVEGENQPFTPDELPVVLTRLEELKGQMEAASDKSDETLKLIEQRFDFLEEQAKIAGRTSFFLMLLGSILGHLLSSSLSGEQVRAFIQASMRIMMELNSSPMQLP